MIKCIARLKDLQGESFRLLMERVNSVIRGDYVQKYTTYSRVWEYPWVWVHLEALKGQGITVLDIGSERSPFPWFLAMQGFQVIVSDFSGQYWHIWRRASQDLGVVVRKRILDAQNLALPPASADVYLSVSVIEHVPNKDRVILEAARVLRPGGLLVMTFDICEPDLGMTFPEWNGRALTMREFDELFRNSPWFEPGLSELPWNTDDVAEYLSWHRTTAPHHNYVTGAAVVQRNDRIWVEPAWKSILRNFNGKVCSIYHVARWPLYHVVKNAFHGTIRIFRATKFSPQRILRSFPGPRLLSSIGEPLFWLLNRREKGREINLSQVKRVLVLRLDEIGDVVLTTPFLRELRRNLPNAWITLVVNPSVYNLVKLCPYVNEVLTYNWEGHRLLRPLQRHWRALRLAKKKLWPRHFDLVIHPRWDADHYHSTFLAYFSGARWRAGYSENVNASKKRLNGGFDRLLTHVLDNNTLKHEVVRSLDVIRFLGGEVQGDRLELWVDEKDEAFAEKSLGQHGVQHEKLVVGFGPSGGNSLLKQWPASNFTAVGRWLKEKYGGHILIVGGPGDEALGKEIEAGIGSAVINMVDKTTLREMAALLKRCHLYIGNDAGPMHVAAAMNVPLVALFGSSCHHRFGPWHKPSILLWSGLPCSPCFQEHHPDRCQRCIFDRLHCMLNITVDQVKEAVTHLICTKGNMLALGDGVVEKNRTAEV